MLLLADHSSPDRATALSENADTSPVYAAHASVAANDSAVAAVYAKYSSSCMPSHCRMHTSCNVKLPEVMAFSRQAYNCASNTNGLISDGPITPRYIRVLRKCSSLSAHADELDSVSGRNHCAGVNSPSVSTPVSHRFWL